MRPYILIILFSCAALSCKQNSEKKSIQKIDYLSNWFIQNEDSLYDELTRLATKELKGYDDEKYGYTSNHQPPDTYMGRFTQQVKKYCDSLDVSFSYNKNFNPKANILITTNYNRRLTKALDTILNSVSHPKYFQLFKYYQSSTDSTTDILTLDNGDVVLKDLRVQIIPTKDLYDLIIYIPTKETNKKVSESDYEFLRTELFGEELFLKKINNLTILFSETIKPNLLSVFEARNKLK
jgi:hypothetical protein